MSVPSSPLAKNDRTIPIPMEIPGPNSVNTFTEYLQALQAVIPPDVHSALADTLRPDDAAVDGHIKAYCERFSRIMQNIHDPRAEKQQTSAVLGKLAQREESKADLLVAEMYPQLLEKAVYLVEKESVELKLEEEARKSKNKKTKRDAAKAERVDKDERREDDKLRIKKIILITDDKRGPKRKRNQDEAIGDAGSGSGLGSGSGANSN